MGELQNKNYNHLKIPELNLLHTYLIKVICSCSLYIHWFWFVVLGLMALSNRTSVSIALFPRDRAVSIKTKRPNRT